MDDVSKEWLAGRLQGIDDSIHIVRCWRDFYKRAGEKAIFESVFATTRVKVCDQILEYLISNRLDGESELEYVIASEQK